MPKGRKGEVGRAKEMEARLLSAWHDPAERDNSIKARAKRGLQLGSVRATERLIGLIESQDERVALAASREVLQRVFGQPKAEVAVNVTDSSQAHLEALKSIYQKAVETIEQGAAEKPLIDHEAEDATISDDMAEQMAEQDVRLIEEAKYNNGLDD